jgi:hypothetical protein
VVEDAHWADEATPQHRVQLLAGDLASSALSAGCGWRRCPAGGGGAGRPGSYGAADSGTDSKEDSMPRYLV